MHASHADKKGFTNWISRWLFTTNHKDIGSMYLWFSFFMFLFGGVMALMMRLELFQPGQQILDHSTYNEMVTMHGLIMVFGAIMPAFVGLANWMIPLMIGAPDMAFFPVPYLWAPVLHLILVGPPMHLYQLPMDPWGRPFSCLPSI